MSDADPDPAPALRGSLTPPCLGAAVLGAAQPRGSSFVYTRGIFWITRGRLFGVTLKVSLSISSPTVGALSRVFTQCSHYCLSPSLLRGLSDPEKGFLC